MKDFKTFVLDWWNEYLDDHEDDAKRIMESMIVEEETIDDYIPDDADSCIDWLRNNDDPYDIYTSFFGYDAPATCLDDMPDTQTFLTDMFKQAASWADYSTSPLPSFADDFVQDMASHAEGYKTPDGFFKDLAYGGCVSGMVGMLIYNSDCKDIYIKHIDDMESYKLQLEGELGSPIQNEKELPHYTFMCWLCYEELAYNIGRSLFPETF